MRGVVVQAPGRGGRGEPPDVGGVRANPPTERPGGHRGAAHGHPRKVRADAARGQGLSVREIGWCLEPVASPAGAEVLPQEASASSPAAERRTARRAAANGRALRVEPMWGRWERYLLMPGRSNSRPPGSADAAWRPCASPRSRQPMPRRARCSSASTIQGMDVELERYARSRDERHRRRCHRDREDRSGASQRVPGLLLPLCGDGG